MSKIKFPQGTGLLFCKIILAAGLAVLPACGGGGGGSGSSSSSSSSSSGGPVRTSTFTVTASTVAIAAKYRAPAPDSVILTAHITDSRVAAVAAAYKPGVSPASWLDVGAAQRGASDVDFHFSVSASGLTATPGTYSTTVTLGSADSAGNVLSTRDIDVTMTLRDGLRIGTGAIHASGFNGDSDAVNTHTFTVEGPGGIQWTASSNASWLKAPAGTFSGIGNFTVTTDYGDVRSGLYDGVLTLTNTADSTDRATLRASLFVQPRCASVSFTSASNIIGGESGLDPADIPVQVQIGNGARFFPYTVSAVTSSGGDWVRFNSTTGSANSTWSSFLVNADRSQLAPGVYNAEVSVVSNINGELCRNTVPMTLRLEANRLMVTTTGVAFSVFPSRSVLTRTLRVLDTRDEGDVTWNAVDDASWLGVTASGSTAGADGGALQLVANPAGLAPGQYYAQVVISSSVAGRVQNQETIRVGLTVRNTDPPATIDIPGRMGAMAVNPVDPEFYASDGMGGLHAYDVYSGALLRSYGDGAGYSELAVSGDGNILYRRQFETVYATDRVTAANLDSWHVPDFGGGITFARPDAHPVLITRDTWIVDLEHDIVRGGGTGSIDPSAFSPNQRVVYGVAHSGSGRTVEALTLRYSSLVEARMSYRRAGEYQRPDTGSYADVGASQVSNRIFAGTSGLDRRVEVFTAPTLTPLPNISTDAQHAFRIVTSWTGRLAVFGSGVSGATLWFYDDEGTLISALSPGMGNPWYDVDTLFFSGDATRLISGTDAQGRIQSVD